MSLPRDKAWFAAKEYGWGWGLPLKWQGWCALGAYLLATVTASVVAAVMVHQLDELVYFLAGVLACSLLLVGICFWKGEAPRWRWGNRTDGR